MLNPKLDFKADAFHCPHCGVYAKQEWHNVAKGALNDRGIGFYEGFIPELFLSFCSQCGNYAIWFNDKIIYPEVSNAPWPTEDMPETVKDGFLEARNIVYASPKAACAFLRLAVQKLMSFLGESGKNLELDVSNLIKKGLPTKYRDALRAVHVIGFTSVRPGEISGLDNVETAFSLFNLLNALVEATISQRRKANPVYIVLPESKPLRKKRARKRARRSKKTEVIPTPTLLYR